jgi:hypothetical protein
MNKILFFVDIYLNYVTLWGYWSGKGIEFSVNAGPAGKKAFIIRPVEQK